MALNSKKPSSPRYHNQTREEQKAIDSLLNNPDIVIKPADKGSAIVVMNLRDYIAEGESQLQNPEYYIEVPSDRTKRHKEEVDLVLDAMLDDKQISKKCHQYLSEGAWEPRYSICYQKYIKINYHLRAGQYSRPTTAPLKESLGL